MAIRQPPPPPEWAVPRRRLLGALDGDHGPLLVLRAGAGYGKTVLAAQWAAARPDVGWLDLEAAVRTGPFLRLPPGGVVVDNFQPGRLELRATLEEILKVPRRGARLLLLTRADLGAAFEPVLASDGVREIGPFELALDAEEVREMFRCAGVDLDEDTLGQLMRRTLGWPIATRMALTEMRSGRKHVLDVEDGTLAGYFESTIWGRLDREQRDFATECAVLDELRPTWCDVLVGRGDSAKVLRKLRSLDSWVLPPTGPGKGFRFHPLVREFLLSRLDAEPRRRRELEARAAHILREGKQALEAVGHALRAEAWELAIECVRHSADRAFRQGQRELLSGLLTRFPVEYRDRPELLRVEGYLAWASGDLEVAFAKAEQATATDDADLRADALTLLAAVHYSKGNLVAEADALSAAIACGPSDRHVLGKAWFGLGSLHYRAGRLGEAEAALQRAVSLAHEGEPLHASVTSMLALLPLGRGNAVGAIPGLERAISRHRAVGNLRGAAHACYHLAIAFNQAGMHERALNVLEEARRHAQELDLAHLAALIERETADALRDLRSPDAADCYRRAIAALDAQRAASGLLHAYHGLAVWHRRNGSTVAARRSAAKALSYCDSGDPAFAALVRLHAHMVDGGGSGSNELLTKVLESPNRYYHALAQLYSSAMAGAKSASRARDVLALIEEERLEHLLDEEPTLAGRLRRLAGEQTEPPRTAVSAGHRFRLNLLAGPELLTDGDMPLRLRPQALRLLAYLALRRGATVTTQQLLDAMWPDRGDEMRPTLQTLVWLLRRNLGESVVVTRNNGYSFDPEGRVQVDVEEFGRLLREGKLEEAIDSYRGELLPDLDWAELERRQLENRYLRALASRAEQLVAEGNFEGGIVLLEEILAVDPLAEDVHEKLVNCHRQVGRDDVALRLRRQFAQRLERDLGVSVN